MTLIKKMALGVLTMLLLVFIGTYLITMNNARNFFIQQIESNAQDTATSLGLSLSQSFLNHDAAMMNSMVQAVFDRGYFSLIQVKDIKGKVIVSKVMLPPQNRIPDWFINLVKLPVMEKSSLVMNGWMQAGIVSVTSDPGYVYASLWRNALGMVKAYLLFALIALVLVYGFIQFLLRPLKRVTAQALAISEHEFPIETKIPGTLELKQVTQAMNQMVIKIKSLFAGHLQQTESLRIQVYQDQLTGLGNRRSFLQQLSAILDNEDEFIPGYILMITIDGLDELNQQQGYQQGDQLVLTIARNCRDFWNQPSVSILARINGSTFALISHESDADIFENECLSFEQILKQALGVTTPCTIHMGAVSYFAHQSVSNLLTIVDLAIRQAREKGIIYCHKEYDEFKRQDLISPEDIKNALEHKNISLYAQSVTNGTESLHKELFVRFRDSKGELYGAGYFMPLAEKSGLASLIDLYVLKDLSARPIDFTERFALNISADTIINAKQSKEYLRQLKQLPLSYLHNLSLEISESIIISDFSKVRDFVIEAQKLGVEIGIDRAGIHFSPLNYLSDLHIDYLKLHGGMSQDLDENESKQFLLHYFNEMAKTLDIKVIATQIEEKEQWLALQLIHITWGQGRYLAGVEPLMP